ncbi:MAG: hypothetical protein AAF865_15600 [Pseudomonadota bacterium]
MTVFVNALLQAALGCFASGPGGAQNGEVRPSFHDSECVGQADLLIYFDDPKGFSLVLHTPTLPTGPIAHALHTGGVLKTN